MQENQQINIVILDDENRPTKYFYFHCQNFLNMPHVGETLIIKLGEREETKLHEVVVTKVEHHWTIDPKTSSFLSSCDNYIWCKYENSNTP